MVGSISLPSLTPIERFSLTEKFTHKMTGWNHSVKHPKLGPAGARILGCACVAFTSLADVLIHAALAFGKGAAALSVLALRCCITVPRDLHLSSSLVHLMNAVRSIFNAAILPFICLLNPDRAYRIVHPHTIENKKDQNATIENGPTQSTESIQEKNAKLEDEIKIAKNDLEKRSEEIEKLNKDLQEINQRNSSKTQVQEQKIESGAQEPVKHTVDQDSKKPTDVSMDRISVESATANIEIQKADDEAQKLNERKAALEQEKAQLSAKIAELEIKIQSGN